MKQLHPIQLKILKKLSFAKNLRYSNLKPSRLMENNKFNFHLDELVKRSYVKKENNTYSLTDIGKEYIGRLDTENLTVPLSPKVSVSICCTRKKNGATQYLIGTRRKQPFYESQAFVSGKVRFGETILSAAKRELKEEINLDGNPEIVSLRHYLVINKNQRQLLEDLYIFLCLVRNPKGNLKANKEAIYTWIAEEDLKNFVINHIESYSSFEEQIKLIKNHKKQKILQEVATLTDKF